MLLGIVHCHISLINQNIYVKTIFGINTDTDADGNGQFFTFQNIYIRMLILLLEAY